MMRQHQATMLPVMRPQLPSADDLLPYLRRIDEARIYSNFGPLHAEFSERLAEYFGVGADQVALIANGTLALQAAVETVGEIGDTWVMPSWTFVASGQAVLAARRRIHFVDVDRETWAISPNQRAFAGGTLVVAPFGSRPEVAAWRNIDGPKVFDAASCFDACFDIGSELGQNDMVMVSLHATKPLPAGEGAVLIGPSPWVRRAAVWGNFGFNGSRFADGPGMNGKLSEYHSAIGLASLDTWDSRRTRWRMVAGQAEDVLTECGLTAQPSLGKGYVTSTWNTLLPEGLHLGDVMESLRCAGIESRSWWPCGVHQMSAFLGQTGEALPVTEELARRVLGLPFFVEMGAHDFGLVSRCLQGLACHLDSSAAPLLGPIG